MLLSMTGYGRASQLHGNKTISVELRSLNSKYTDLRLRAPQNLRERELEIRRLVTDFAQRGKLEMTVEINAEEGADDLQVNGPLLNRLYQDVVQASRGKIGDEDAGHLFNSLLRMPNVITAGSSEMSDEEWEALRETTKACLENFNYYRRQEGKVMANDLREHAQAIKELLEKVTPFETERVTAVRERMARHLEEYLGKPNVDKNRYEQEVLFYLEKIDINEEKVRLAQNCDYFLEILDNKKEAKGRKLSFISQEIGREVNTLGAKAYSADIQKLVVNMKEHLEKIKEQLANVV
ncbi:MAG: YicC/YloC family endoribonuclease [Bacteroidota bacterium]